MIISRVCIYMMISSGLLEEDEDEDEDDVGVGVVIIECKYDKLINGD